MLLNIIFGFFSSIIAVLVLFLYKGCLHLCSKIAVINKVGKTYYKFKIFNKGLFTIHNIKIDASVIERGNSNTHGIDKVQGHLCFYNDSVWELPGILFKGSNYKNAYRFVSNGNYQNHSKINPDDKNPNSHVGSNYNLQKALSENSNIFLRVRINYSAPLTGLTKTISREFSSPFKEGDFRLGMNCNIEPID